MLRQPLSCTLRVKFRCTQRFYKFTTAVVPRSKGGEETSTKSYKDIPGPKGYPLIGTALDYRGGKKFKPYKVMKQRFDKYGPIYREQMFPGLSEQVVIFEPKDVETVFRADGQIPNRPTANILLKPRKEAGMEPGILQLQGKKWYDGRMPMSKFMSVPRKIAEYHEELDGITSDLIENIYHLRNPDSNLVTDIPDLLFKWSFESVAFFMFGKRLGALGKSGNIHPDCKEFIDQVGNWFTQATDMLFSLPLYKFYPTKLRRDFVATQKVLKELTMKFINERLKETGDEQKQMLEEESDEAPAKVDFLTYLLHSGKMDLRGITTNVIDLLTAGVDTTSYTLSWALYLLATNVKIQERLRSEVEQVLGSEKIVTPTHINQMEYLRNCIKETMRLYPLTGFNQRVLQQDVILSGYSVPAGNEITIPLIIMGRMPELFHDPDSFIPERWSKENKDSLPSMFSSLPFGFGPRMCIGRRLAELELHIALAQVMKNFKVEYHDKEPMTYVQRFVVKPERQLDLSFI